MIHQWPKICHMRLKKLLIYFLTGHKTASDSFTWDRNNPKKPLSLSETCCKSLHFLSLIIYDQTNSKGITHRERQCCSRGEKLLSFSQKNNLIPREDCCNNASLFTNTKAIPMVSDSTKRPDCDGNHAHEKSFADDFSQKWVFTLEA